MKAKRAQRVSSNHECKPIDINNVKLACLHVLEGQLPPSPRVGGGDLVCEFCLYLKGKNDKRFEDNLRALCPGCIQKLAQVWQSRGQT